MRIDLGRRTLNELDLARGWWVGGEHEGCDFHVSMGQSCESLWPDLRAGAPSPGTFVVVIVLIVNIIIVVMEVNHNCSCWCKQLLRDQGRARKSASPNSFREGSLKLCESLPWMLEFLGEYPPQCFFLFKSRN